MGTKSPEAHLFIIWKNGRTVQTRILHDIASYFHILKVYEVSWSPSNFSNNLTRFYGTNLPPNSFKEQHCGKGDFILAVVEDPSPEYAERKTSHGPCVVNVNMFDRKQCYRQWTGGGHRIHATDTAWEFNHDMTLVVGKNAQDFLLENKGPWDGQVTPLKKDLEGACGWRDIRQLFYVLNNTIEYVVLRNFEGIPEEYTMATHGDIDLLTSDPANLCYLLNAKRVFPQSYRVLHATPVRGEQVLFDLRHVGDGYYDKAWEKHILSSRILDSNGFYRPDKETYFYTLLYHALIHKPEVAADYRVRLPQIAHAAGIDLDTGAFENPPALMEMLWVYLSRRQYEITEPKDLSVHFNTNNAPNTRLSITRILTSGRSDHSVIKTILDQTPDLSCGSQALRYLVHTNVPVLREHFSPHRINYLKAIQPAENKRVIVFYTQSGMILRYLAEQSAQVTAMASNPENAELLRLRCKGLDNVQVLTNLKDISEQAGTYDYGLVEFNTAELVRIDAPDKFIRMQLDFAFGMTAPDGKVIAAVDNRDSVLARFDARAGGVMDEKQLLKTVDSLGVKGCELFYAFPDFRSCNTIMTADAAKAASSAFGSWAASGQFYKIDGAPFHDARIDTMLSEFAAQGRLGEKAGSIIAVLSRTDTQERTGWQVKAFNEETRRPETATSTTLFQDQDGKLTVEKQGCPASRGIFLFQPRQRYPFYNGYSLESAIMRNIVQGDVNGFYENLILFCRYIGENHASEFTYPPLADHGDLYVEGKCFDMILRNIIVENGVLHPIDLEWQSRHPIPLSLVLYRALYNLAYKVSIPRLAAFLGFEKKDMSTNQMFAMIIGKFDIFTGTSSRVMDIYEQFQGSFWHFVNGTPPQMPSFFELYSEFFGNVTLGPVYYPKAIEKARALEQYYKFIPETRVITKFIPRMTEELLAAQHKRTASTNTARHSNAVAGTPL